MEYLLFPSFRPQTSKWMIKRLNQYTGRGLTSGVPLASGSPGGLWMVSAQFVLNRQNGAFRAAFLDRIQGSKNRIVTHHWLHAAPMGAPSGNPVVNGSGQTGNAISTRSWSGSRQGLLLPGDMVGIGGELKRVVQSVNANSSGYATLYFEPELRRSPTNGSSIDTNLPTARFYLAAHNASTDEAGFYTVNLELLEDPA